MIPTHSPVFRRAGYFLPLLCLTACIQHRQLVNFNEGPEFSAVAQQMALANPIKLQPDDIISISIQTVDPVASAPFNLGGMPITGSNADNSTITGTGTTVTTIPTYLIDNQGRVNLPMLGPVKVAGWTTLQARDSLTVRLGKYLKDQIVNVRLVNFKFTILGEVTKAGSFSIPNERINILEALGMAGDLTNYGDRERILIIREKDGQRSFGYLNLHQRDLFQSPYFYLSQNDMVYVEPMKAKIGSTTDASSKFLQWALPIISVVSIIVSLTR